MQIADMTHPLRSWRIQHEIRLIDLAERAGVSTATISRIEGRRTNPTMQLVAKIIAITDGAVSASDFLPQTAPSHEGASA